MVYSDIWCLVAQYCENEEREKLKLVEKNAYEAIQYVNPLPKQISKMIYNNYRIKLLSSLEKCYHFFQGMRSKDLFEPLFIANKKNNYQMIVCICLAKKECKMLASYLLLFFKEYKTILELFIMNFLKVFNHEKAIKNIMKRFTFDTNDFFNNTKLMIQTIYKKMDKLEKNRYELYYVENAKMLGCNIPKPKNKISFY